MADTTIELVMIDGLNPSEYLLVEEVEKAGFSNNFDFDRACVAVLFRAHGRGLHTPIRIWFKKADVPEDQWLRHAKLLAVDFLGDVARLVAEEWKQG